MAGRKKREGIDFSGWDVDVFEDEKIIQLVDRLGLNAFVVFFAVCQRAYGARGYYLPWPAGEAVMIRRALGSEVTGQYISDVVDLCLDLGLFHADTFAQYGVLTSRAIQRNFVVVLQRRRRKEVLHILPTAALRCRFRRSRRKKEGRKGLGRHALGHSNKRTPLSNGAFGRNG